MTVLNSYKYLGLFLTTRMTSSNAPNEMANKARKGVTDIFRMLWRLGDFSAPIFFKMFDAQIKPMLLYGSEIWGLKEYKSVEKVHTFALKKLLNVNPMTWHMERQVFSTICSLLYSLYKVLVTPYYNGHFKATTKGLQYAVIAA